MAFGVNLFYISNAVVHIAFDEGARMLFDFFVVIKIIHHSESFVKKINFCHKAEHELIFPDLILHSLMKIETFLR